MRISRIGLSFIILISGILLFTFLNFGSIDDFMFQHVAVTQKFINLNHIYDSDPIISNENTGLSGFYSFAIIFSSFTGLSVLQIFLIPIILIPTLIILFVLLKQFSKNIVLVSLIILIFSTYSLSSNLTYQPHGYGIVLFFCVLLVFIKSEFNITLTNLILISLFALGINYTSYKDSFLLLSTLLAYLFFQYFKSYFMKIKEDLINKSYIILFTTFLILTVNNFFYNTALNAFKVINQSWFTYGIDKITAMFFSGTKDILDVYNISFTSPRILTLIISARFILLSLIIASYIFFIFINFTSRHYAKLSKTNDWVLALILGIGVNILIYNLYGAFDPGLLIFPGFIIIVIYASRVNFGRFIPLIVVLFLLFNSGYQYLERTDQLISTDYHLFSYLSPSEGFYQRFGNQTSYTDVLTRGYYLTKMVNQNTTNYPEFISNDDLLMMLKKSDVNPGVDKLYILNFRLSILAITNWRSIKPFRDYESIIDANIRLNKVYSTPGDVSFYYFNT